MIRKERMILGAAALLTAAITLVSLDAHNHLWVVRAQSATGAPIHGYVAAVLTPELQIAAAVNRGPIFNVPDINVVAKNIKTLASSAVVRTNPQGYFRTDLLPPGEYQICVDGVGYVSSCEQQVVAVTNSVVVLDHVVEIRPAAGVVAGTVRLADQVTPCFWFRPAFDTQAVIAPKVSLLDGGGKVVAGPVNGNSLGQYVLPVSSGTVGANIEAVCEGSTTRSSVKFAGGTLLQDIVIRDNAPQLVSFDLSKSGLGVRRADPGDVVHATVVATDLDGDTLHYKWIDDSGRSLGLPDSPSVDWPVQKAPSVNTLRVQISDGKGGFTVGSRTLRAGLNELLFEGILLNRQTQAAIANADITLNGVTAHSNAAGHFEVNVPDAPRFVLNINKSGFALSSRVFYGRATGLQVPIDPTQSATVNAVTGGPVVMPAGECECACQKRHDEDDDRDRDRDDRRADKDDRQKDKHDRDHDKHCKHKGRLSFRFPAHALIDANGNPFNGTARIEMFQYDTSLTNPIPGDLGAVSQGKTVRLSTFGAIYVQPRDSAGKPLQMAPNKKVQISMPIEAALLAKAPATIPLFRYEESTGLWSEQGTLTRSGNNYVGDISHFSVFNADTKFPGGACVKAILDPASFTLPVTLDATYVDPNSGAFYHNGTQATDSVVGIERMTPNVNFTLEVHDGASNQLLQTVTLYSGPGLDPVQFPDGLDTDPNFGHCNGPVTIYNPSVYNSAMPTGPTYIMPVTGGSIKDNSAAYQIATDAQPGGTRDTFTHWLQANGFTSGEPQAIYFNNGDLKFGRNMHCRVKNAANGAAACYVSNYGIVGTDDSTQALQDARNPAQVPVATVAMEYDPTATGHEVQFWAYNNFAVNPNGDYLPKPALDSQGGKPMPDICLACHGGYFDTVNNANKASKAVFLPFDLDSFIYDNLGDPHTSSTAQEQFRQLNNIVLGTHPDTLTGDTNNPFSQLMSLWYPTGVGNVGSQFSFNHAVAANQGGFTSHEPLYDSVVKPVCRTCHITRSNLDDWTSFNLMSTGAFHGLIPIYACGSGSPATHQTQNFAMPHAEVPFKRYWQNSLSTTLASELSLAGGCPNQ